MKMPFFTIMVVFVIWFTIKLKMSDKENAKSKEDFLERENNANLTRKKSLDSLNYITIPLDRLPFCEETDKEILEFQEKVKILSTKKIVNLTGISNTDLKLEYGAANLNDLTEYDKNFTDLARTLYLWGKALYAKKQFDDSKCILEFAVSQKSDVGDIYVILADIYKQTNNTRKIYNLIDTAKELDSLTKNSIIRKLNGVLTQCGHTAE